ncbi:MAG: right-handed parallel beta-helix repeat-containing protein, partial [Candidatus Eisenbacteria sp.]|nr:right-handed parallel beta-helix repeat-containing protein [Candidatus Eisenbacteria bacterium]
MRDKVSIFLAIVLLGLGTTSLWAADLEVSQPVQVTNDTYYERGQSVVYDGTNYWLFYGRSATCEVPYSGGNPDVNDYKLYYKKAGSIAGLASASATAVQVSGSPVDDCYLGETGAAYIDSKVWAFVTIHDGVSNTDLYGYYTSDGGATWTEVGPYVEDMSGGQGHHDEVVFGGELWILEGSGNYHTMHSSTPTNTGSFSTPLQVGATESLTGGMGHFFVDSSDLYLALGSGDTYYIYKYNSGTTSWDLIDSKTIAGYYDPTLYKVGSNYVFHCAPYSGGRQWIVGWTGTTLDGSFFDGDELDVIEGRYGANVWVDMWPIGFTSGGSSYLFYTSERDEPDAEGTGNIWYLEVDWDVTLDHYTYIQEAIDEATGTTINVAAGIYAEYLYINKDNLSIEGAGIDQSILDLDGLVPYWHYGMLSSSFAGRGGVTIDGYQNTGGEADLIENVTFKGFTVKNAGENPPVITATHTGPDNAANLTDNTASWTPNSLVGQWITNAGDYIDNSGGRQFFRAEITANTATTITATYISGGDEQDWDIGDTYVISPYREWYDGALEGRDDVRGIRIVSGKNITIEDCKVQYCGDRAVSSGRSRFDLRKPSENITIHNCTLSDNHDAGIGVGDTHGTITITGNTVSNNSNPATEGCTYSGSVGPPDCHVGGMHIGGRSSTQTLTGTISGNTVSGNAYHGIDVYKYTDGIVVNNNTVTGHNLNPEGAGIFVSTGWEFTKTCKNHTVSGNIVTGNIRGIIAYYAWGDNPGDLTIEDNTITTDSGTFDPGQAAIKIDHAYNLEVIDNDISCDGTGIRVHSSDSYDNSFVDNTIDGAIFAGVYITSGAHDNTFTDNTITGTTSDTFTQYADWGSHSGGDNVAVLTDGTKAWTPGAFVGFTVLNLTDGSSGTVTANDATTVTAALSGGTDDDWDTGDEYDIVYDETKAAGVFLRGGSCYAGGHAGTGNTFQYNSIYGNGGDGMENQTVTAADAEFNWWGDASGPDGEGPGTGDAVSTYVDYSPWLGYTPGTSPMLWGTDDCIQDAIDEASSGDAINVIDGSYGADPVTGRCAYITKDGLSLIGESESGTIIDGAIGGVGSSGSYWPKGIHVQANNVTIQNLTVQGFTGELVSPGGYGILFRDYAHDTPGEGYIFYTGGTVRNVTSQNNCYPMYALVHQYLTVDNCLIQNNLSDGMFIARESDYATITDNTVLNSGDHGIWVGKCWTGLGPSDDAVITGNTVDGAREGGISFVASDGATIEGNVITNVAGEGYSKGALNLRDSPSNVTARYNIIYGNDGSWGGYGGTGNGVSIVGGTPSGIVLNWNSIYGNTGYGCYNYSTTTVDAQFNWWGDASGPTPAKAGDRVTDYVDYDPWIGKTGSENIICDPDPQYLTNAVPTNTVDVNYLGGGSGLVYGYSVSVSWDAAKVNTPTITEGTLLSGGVSGTTYFSANGTGNSLTIDCVLLGDVDGVTGPGTMFTISYTGAGCGTDVVQLT